MENNKGYLGPIGPVFVFTVLSSVAIILLSKVVEQGYYDNPFTLYRIIIQVLPFAVSMAGIAWATKQPKAGAASFGVYLALLFGQYMLAKNNISSLTNANWWIFVQLLVYIVPFFFFFVFAGVKASKLPFIFAITLLLPGTNVVYHASNGISWLGNLLDYDTELPVDVSTILSLVVGQMIHILLIGELLNYANEKNDGFHRRIINPGNEYDKFGGTVVFWSLKAFMVLAALGSFSLLKTLVEYFYRYEDYAFGGGSVGFLKWYFMFMLLSTVLLVMGAAWYFRKFTLEYFFSHGISSRFLYWFIQWPLLGFFGWLGVLGNSIKNYEFKDRKATLEQFSSAGTNSIVTLFMILTGLRVLLVLINGEPATILGTLVSAGLLFWMLNSVDGYKFNLYATVFLLLVLLLFPVFKSRSVELLTYFPFLLLNLGQIIMIHPALHFGSFNYLSYEEEKPWQPGDDLF